MRRDLTILLLGVWMMGTVSMAVVAIQNFYVIDRLLESGSNESFRAIVAELAPVPSRAFMRYLSSELNRLFFQVWGWAQLGLGVAVLWTTWRLGRRGIRYAVGLMLLLAGVQILGLIPPIVSVGRALDFVPRDPPPPELTTFGVLHAAYTITDVIKFSLNLVVAFWVTRTTRREPFQV